MIGISNFLLYLSNSNAGEKLHFTLRIAIVLGIFLCTASCAVVTFKPVLDIEPEAVSSTTTKDPLFLLIKRSYEKGLNATIGAKIPQDEVLSALDDDYKHIRETFEQYLPAKTIIQGTEPQPSQTFVRVTIFYNYEASYHHKGWCEGGFLTLAVIPCYGDLWVYDTRYELFRDGILQKQFMYTFSMRGAIWLGLLPFFWVNLFTDGYEDALESTVRQFLHEAVADGHL